MHTHHAMILTFPEPETGDPLLLCKWPTITKFASPRYRRWANEVLARADTLFFTILGSGVQARSPL